MTAALTPPPKAQFFAADGTPLVNGRLYSYVAGTTTPLATYVDSAGITTNTNPVILNSRGEANVWLDNVLYKLALHDATDALIWTVDNVSANNRGIFDGPVSGTTGTFSGALTALSGTFSGLLTAPNLTFSGTGGRIRGDFSNATIANRVSFQTSTSNSSTFVGAIPNGTDPSTFFSAFNNSNPANAGVMQIGADATAGYLRMNVTGAGTYLPMTFTVNGVEAGRFNINGNFHLGGTASSFPLQITRPVYTGEYIRLTSGSAIAGLGVTTGDIAVFYTGGTERFRYDQNVGLVITSVGSIGYGTGAGGTVTQTTNKATPVTLNKASGQITMNNASLAAGARVTFTLNNNLIATTDVPYVCVSGAFTGYDIQARVTSAGVANIVVHNISGGPLSEAVVLNYVVIKGAAA